MLKTKTVDFKTHYILHQLRDALEAVHNTLTVEYVEDEHVRVALNSIEQAIKVSRQ